MQRFPSEKNAGNYLIICRTKKRQTVEYTFENNRSNFEGFFPAESAAELAIRSEQGNYVTKVRNLSTVIENVYKVERN